MYIVIGLGRTRRSTKVQPFCSIKQQQQQQQQRNNNNNTNSNDTSFGKTLKSTHNHHEDSIKSTHMNIPKPRHLKKILASIFIGENLFKEPENWPPATRTTRTSVKNY